MYGSDHWIFGLQASRRPSSLCWLTAARNENMLLCTLRPHMRIPQYSFYSFTFSGSFEYVFIPSLAFSFSFFKISAFLLFDTPLYPILGFFSSFSLRSYVLKHLLSFSPTHNCRIKKSLARTYRATGQSSPSIPTRTRTFASFCSSRLPLQSLNRTTKNNSSDIQMYVFASRGRSR